MFTKAIDKFIDLTKLFLETIWKVLTTPYISDEEYSLILEKEYEKQKGAANGIQK
jgi:hypothetical protein